MESLRHPDKSATQTRNPTGWHEQAAVSFPDWKESLQTAALNEASRGAHFRAILGFLKHCKSLRCPASIGAARGYLDQRERSGAALPGEREGLRWFFRAARDRDKEPVRPASPGGHD